MVFSRFVSGALQPRASLSFGTIVRLLFSIKACTPDYASVKQIRQAWAAMLSLAQHLALSMHLNMANALFLCATLAILVRVDTNQDIEGAVLTEEDTEIKEPEEYRVLLLNDDYTTMEFVVAVIMSVFHKGLFEATRIMLDVHRKGKGIVGTYSYDIAATKISKVHKMARENGFPLKSIMEKA